MQRLATFCALLICGTAGYFGNEYLHLKVENIELRALVSQATQLAEQRGDAVSSCMSSLTSCSRIIDAENPQFREGLQRPDSKKAQLAQKRGP